MMPGMPERRTHSYVRHGTTSLFAALDIASRRRGVHTSTSQPEQDIRSFLEWHNENPKPYRWTKSTNEILASGRRSCQTAERTLSSEIQIQITRACFELADSRRIHTGAVI
jgi:hypothetical protein